MKENFFKLKSHKETGMKIMFGAAASVAILATVTIFVFLFYKGIPAVSVIGLGNFLFGQNWMPNVNDIISGEVNGQYGIFPMIVGTIYATVGAVIIGGTLGYFTAVFLSKFCPNKLKAMLSQLVNLLAGIPSVVYGFFGMRVLLPILGQASPNGSGSGILAVSIILGIMIMPTIVALSKTAIDAVPAASYDGARALGDSHAQAVFGTVVPAAKSGITASFILGIGRAVGETMAVIMVAGNNPVIPDSIFGSFRTMTANVVLEMGYAGELQLGALIATGCVLFFFVFVINTLFGLIRNEGNLGKKANRTARKTEKHDNKLKVVWRNVKAFFSRRGKAVVEIKHTLCYICTSIGVAALVAIVVIISIIASLFLGNELLKPLNGIKTNLQCVVDGTYKTVIPATDDNSINELISEINAVSNKLQVSIASAREDKQKLDYVIDNVSDGIIVFGTDGNIALINPNAQMIFGITEAVGRNAEVLTANPTFVGAVSDCFATKNSSIFELKLNEKIYLCAIKYTDNGLIIAVLSDITASRNNEQMRSEFFANASHELKTPLTSIKGFNEMIALKSKDKTIQGYSQKIERESMRMLTLIDDMLNLSKLENTQTIVKNEIDVKKVVDEVTDSLAELAKNKNITVEVVGKGRVLAEKENIFELIKNLVKMPFATTMTVAK